MWSRGALVRLKFAGDQRGRAAVLRMVLQQGLLRACYRLAIGCVLSIAVGRVLRSHYSDYPESMLDLYLHWSR